MEFEQNKTGSLNFKISSKTKRGLEEGELCEESAEEAAEEKLKADPLRVVGNATRSRRRIRSERIGFDKGYQEGKKEGEASGFDKGVEEGKQASQKEVASLLEQARRLQLELAYASVESQNFKLRLDQLAAENRSLRQQLNLESPREDDGAREHDGAHDNDGEFSA